MISKLPEFESSVLGTYGATATEIEELSAYNQNVFDHSNWQSSLQFPLEPEPYVAIWSEYLNISEEIGVWSTLKNVLVQLHFPIAEGISQTEAYRAATLRGADPHTIPEATGLKLKQPEKLDLKIYPSLAGAIPILLPGNREDFVTLVQALTKRNEPQAIPLSMGACMIAGYNNWSRIRRYRQQWEQENSANSGDMAWKQEFMKLIPLKNLYHDRFIILSDGFYSNVAPQDIELTESEWRQLSLTIRLEHECTHYFTRRLFNSMQNNLLDELIADYRGIVAAIGHYRADWFLRFMGLESFPKYREEGRLQNYRGQSPLSDRAFKILQALVVAAAKNLEHFDRKYAKELKLSSNQPLMLMALTHLTLEELASDQAVVRLETIFHRLQNKTKLSNT
ncbi:hypothetical protein [Pleurocapsa sp. PCC 7319]|uniref:DUF7005 family protein n=1 Tax=Pleurocapsa sp. PCC 7319 TaxID=118161 RepID=UPI000344BCBC|nr:hypothetical protein [Pleurocapsa sp. PCC 7319]